MKRLARTSAFLTVLVALLTLGLVAPGSAASSTGAVKGVMTLDGKPVKGLRVELHLTGDDGFENKTLDVDTTNSKGAYSFRFATDDPEYTWHTIIIKDPSGRIVNTSRRFKDRPGRTVTRNATLKRAGSITGSVRRGDGLPTGRLRVNVFGPFDKLDPDRDLPLSYPESVKAATDGTFTLKGLPAGTFYLGFVDESRTYFPQCYDNIPGTNYERDCDGTNGPAGSGGTTIRVTAGQRVSLEPQVMSTKGRRVSGTVTDTSGRPVHHADVTAYGDGTNTTSGDGSSSTGAFTIGPLRDGRYRLRVDAPSPWASQWFDRRDTRTSATAIDIASGDVSGIRVKLKSRARISAKLTPRTGALKIAVDVTRSATGSKPSGQATIRWGTVSKTVTLVKGKGAVKLSGLPKGKRRITISYTGTSSTAAATKVFHGTVR
ncbi:carboxypeptidase-like regulatory domain-containing protein [Aeromicrobium chenweiae]|uniref:Uncharacterized protein n=1 Tax=Aeromicrobium chenweiae TaxID=2079793 RepID=A0A2S0WRE0_9ACTN|nr:carboxypeptidase-like regulatory domain-containing protein [Aeromicrobium chenweiae]AWB93909.1 hypothetical protein C3E78_17760 [Aeromicrobium chenweiae]TGN30954.1 carboxypeptidase regulatory-like domain-containing protein [Aeromicrobium chenweiae]